MPAAAADNRSGEPEGTHPQGHRRRLPGAAQKRLGRDDGRGREGGSRLTRPRPYRYFPRSGVATWTRPSSASGPAPPTPLEPVSHSKDPRRKAVGLRPASFLLRGVPRRTRAPYAAMISGTVTRPELGSGAPRNSGSGLIDNAPRPVRGDHGRRGHPDALRATQETTLAVRGQRRGACSGLTDLVRAERRGTAIASAARNGEDAHQRRVRQGNRPGATAPPEGDVLRSRPALGDLPLAAHPRTRVSTNPVLVDLLAR